MRYVSVHEAAGDERIQRPATGWAVCKTSYWRDLYFIYASL